jgi:hypothetical protein
LFGGFDPEALTEAIVAAIDQGLSWIVVNMLEIDGVLSISKRYIVGTELAAFVRKQRMPPRIALVGKLPIMDGFSTLVGQSRGEHLGSCACQQEALK